jgi:hypothetical protein
MVTLSASPDATSDFNGWSGACSGTGACTVTMGADHSVGATFTRRRHTLTVATAGDGVGWAVGSGIGCPPTCSRTYDEGQLVTLTAFPAKSSNFDGWTGACSGVGSCTVTMDVARSVAASFSAVHDGRVTSTSPTATPAGNLTLRVLNPNSRSASGDLTAVTTKKFALRASAAGKKKVKHTVALGHAKFTVGRHATAPVTLHLSKKGWALLKKVGKLSVKTTLVLKVGIRTRTTIQTITVSAPKKPKSGSARPVAAWR